MSNNPLRHLSSLTMRAPTQRDNSLPATPRRVRMKYPHHLADEVMDFYVGKSFFILLHGQRVEVNAGNYVGRRGVITHEFIMHNPHLWDKVDEPFVIVSHLL